MLTRQSPQYVIFVVLCLSTLGGAVEGSTGRHLTRANAAPFSALLREPRVQSTMLDARTTVTLTTGSEASLVVRSGGHRVYRMDLRRLRPWKLAVADVDGDGRNEIVLGVYKSTRFWRYEHPCLFVYRWAGGKFSPVWRGSNLSKPFTDFEFVKCSSGPAELLSIEVLGDGRRCLNAYHWNYFGFTADWERGDWKTVAFVSTSTGRARVRVDGNVETFKMR